MPGGATGGRARIRIQVDGQCPGTQSDLRPQAARAGVPMIRVFLLRVGSRGRPRQFLLGCKAVAWRSRGSRGGANRLLARTWTGSRQHAPRVRGAGHVPAGAVARLERARADRGGAEGHAAPRQGERVDWLAFTSARARALLPPRGRARGEPGLRRRGRLRRRVRGPHVQRVPAQVSIRRSRTGGSCASSGPSSTPCWPRIRAGASSSGALAEVELVRRLQLERATLARRRPSSALRRAFRALELVLVRGACRSYHLASYLRDHAPETLSRIRARLGTARGTPRSRDRDARQGARTRTARSAVCMDRDSAPVAPRPLARRCPRTRRRSGAPPTRAAGPSRSLGAVRARARALRRLAAHGDGEERFERFERLVHGAVPVRQRRRRHGADAREREAPRPQPYRAQHGLRHDGGRVDGMRAGPVELMLGSFTRRGEVGVLDLGSLLAGLAGGGRHRLARDLRRERADRRPRRNRLYAESPATLAARIAGATELARAAASARTKRRRVRISTPRSRASTAGSGSSSDCGRRRPGPDRAARLRRFRTGSAAARPRGDDRAPASSGSGSVSLLLQCKEMIHDGLLNAAFFTRYRVEPGPRRRARGSGRARDEPRALAPNQRARVPRRTHSTTAASRRSTAVACSRAPARRATEHQVLPQ